MSVIVTVHDKTPSGDELHTLKLRLASTCISVRALIEQRVEQEVRKFNLERPVCFQALVHPAGAEETARGFRLPVHRDIDFKQQVSAAFEAFRKQNLSVLVDGKEMQDLDTELNLDASCDVTFVKLMPIIGG